METGLFAMVKWKAGKIKVKKKEKTRKSQYKRIRLNGRGLMILETEKEKKREKINDCHTLEGADKNGGACTCNALWSKLEKNTD